MEKILIVDFGSQYTQLIARRIRTFNVYCEIYPCTTPFSEMESFRPKGIILSGGPNRLLDDGSPTVDKRVFELGIPVLGICYGFQLTSKLLGGKVEKASHREYGYANLVAADDYEFKNGLSPLVWMSHGDQVVELPPGFNRLASTDTCLNAIAVSADKKIAGVQFHPEVSHTVSGNLILEDFVNQCGVSRSWNSGSYIEDTVAELRSKIGNQKVLCALSGGVDSAVTAMLLKAAIGDQLKCLFIDNGLLRFGERDQVQSTFSALLGDSFKMLDAQNEFLGALNGITDPEQKRKIIGRTFIEVFENAVKNSELNGCEWLAQGTLYPDVIESVSFKGPSATIKSHHNVGGLPDSMRMKLVEPLRLLFKDEVRAVGRQLGLPDSIIDRQPFPGPGLAIRILGAVNGEKLSLVRKADVIVQQEMSASGLTGSVWQSFATLLPVKTVGVMGDERTYDYMCCIRIVSSDDGMTASVPWPTTALERISTRIVNEVKGINRVVYDITNKPPGTIELE